jgi:ABC-type transport system involved in multi-copper enzyme maturation permease subunit
MTAGRAPLLTSEWRKVTTTKMLWVLVGIAMAYSAIQVGTLVLIAAPGVMEGLGGVPVDESMLLDPEYITTLLSQTATAATFVLLLGIIAMTGEFRHMTITSTFLSTPRRRRVLAAKMVLFGAIGTAAALLAIVTVLITAALALLPFEHAPITADAVVTVSVGTVVGFALYAVLGVSLGALIRSQIGAIILALVWVLLLEALVGLAFPSVAKWLPGGALASVMDVSLRADMAGQFTSADRLPAWGGVLVLLAYSVVLALLALRTTLRRDIT